jgi:hypothetical protein
MFNFPDAPIVGDQYTSGSAVYKWDGISWNIETSPTAADYVLKAGDVMTGALTISGTNDLVADHRIVVNGGGEKVCLRMYGCEIRRGGEGNIELWTDNGGYSTTWGLRMIVDNPPRCEIRKLIMSGAIDFGSAAVTDATDCSRHIILWKNTATAGADFGFNITSGRLNYCTASTSNIHEFYCGDTLSYQIDTVGSGGNIVGRARIPGRGEVAVREEVDVMINALRDEVATLRTEIAQLRAGRRR